MAKGLSLCSDPRRQWGRVRGSLRPRHSVPCGCAQLPAGRSLRVGAKCAGAPPAQAGSSVSSEASDTHCSDQASSQQFCPGRVAVLFKCKVILPESRILIAEMPLS